MGGGGGGKQILIITKQAGRNRKENNTGYQRCMYTWVGVGGIDNYKTSRKKQEGK